MSNDYEVGHKKPPRNRRFGQPEGNKPGLTTETRKNYLKAAENIAKVRAAMSEALAAKIDELGVEGILEVLDANTNKFMLDTENRALGAPKTSVDLSSQDGTMSPVQASEAVLDAIKEKYK